jgi:group I intron endonuclease
MICIYKIISPIDKIYIGKTKNFKNRKKQYKYLNSKNQRKLFYSFQKYGIENHKFEIIEECTLEQLNEKEIYWIKQLNCIEKGLNLTYGGDGGKISYESEELRRLNSMKPIYQYSLEGDFIKEWKGATEAAKYLGFNNSNNINDCSRGKYQSTYGYRWKYKTDIKNIKEKLDPILTHIPKTKFHLYINDIFIKEFKSWKDIKLYGITTYNIINCLQSSNNEFCNLKNKKTYKIFKIK